MHRRYSIAHLILAIVIVLGLTPLMVVVDAQAQIVFMSDRDWNEWQWEIRDGVVRIGTGKST